MIDEIFGPLVRALGRAVGWVLAELFGHLLWFGLCHVTGWIVLRVLTFGRHPPGPLFDREDSGAAEWVGALVLVVAGVVALGVMLG